MNTLEKAVAILWAKEAAWTCQTAAALIQGISPKRLEVAHKRVLKSTAIRAQYEKRQEELEDVIARVVSVMKVLKASPPHGKTPQEWVAHAKSLKLDVINVWDELLADAGEQLDSVPDGAQEVGAGETAADEQQHKTGGLPHLTTSDLVSCFGGFMGVANPKKVLSEYPKWATQNGALVQRGRPGKPSKTKPDISKWNPVRFALNLLDKKPLPQLDGMGDLKQQNLDTVFSMKTLAEWKPIWIKSKPL